MEEEVNRILRNICAVPSYNGTMTVEQVNYFLDKYDTVQFCRGRVVRVVFEKITEKHYTFKTVPV
jgi:hypothetical protein